MHFTTLASVPRSPLAERYPCENCHGEGYGEKQVDVDEFDDDQCVECHGSGADEDAGVAAYIDDWLASNGITVSTHSEHRLRELLISTAAGHDTWDERDDLGASPLVAMPERDEIETFVDDLGNMLLRESREAAVCHYDRKHPYPGAFGRLQAVTTRLLLDVSQGTPLTAAIQLERELRKKVARQTNAGTAGQQRDEPMLVDTADGTCRACGGQLEIVGAGDATLEIECTECGERATVEPDFFDDCGIRYWPEAMVEFGEDL